MLTGVLVCVALAPSACSSPSQGTPDAPISPPDAPVVLRTINGSLNLRFVEPTTEVTLPADLSANTVSVLIPPAFTAISGATTTNGTFSIPSVPQGPYYLKLGGRYLDLTADAVDLSYDLLGRPGVRAATTTTNLTFDVTNLSSWQTTDEIQMICPGSGTIAFGMQSAVSTGAPTAAATSLAGFAYDISRADYPALIDGAAGDRATVTQLATQISGARSFRTVARSFTAPSFTVTNGGTASLTGAFTTVPADKTLDAVWDRPAFQAELATRSPGSAAENFSTLAISALPEASTRGFYHSAADVVVYAPGYTTDSTQVNASWSYGDPYPVAWSRIAWVRYRKYRFIQLGSATPVAIFASLYVYRDLSTISSQAPIVPIIGAVVSPKVNGMDAFATLTGIGTTPTISWSAPTIGTVSKYYVTVVSVTAPNGATTLKSIATIETSATQAVVPPGILVAGSKYVFYVDARSAGALDLSAMPNAQTLPEGSSVVTTAMVTP